MDRQIKKSQKEFVKTDYERFLIVAHIDAVYTQIGIMGVHDKKRFDMIFKNILLTKNIDAMYPYLNETLKQAYDEYGIEISRTVIAAAGPVSRKRGYIKMTNANLTINAQDIITHSLLNKVILLNDFEANGYGLDLLDFSKDVELLPRKSEGFVDKSFLSNTFSVIGSGEGLGITIAHYDLTKHLHFPLPSEGGHIEFSAHDSFELELMIFLQQEIGDLSIHPDFERCVSIEGFVRIYRFLKSKHLFAENVVSAQLDTISNSYDLVKAILSNKNDALCEKTIHYFVTFYARFARNIALMSECYSGLFVVGPIATYAPWLFTDGLFIREFETHDMKSDVLKKIPVYLIHNEDLTLLGCCNVGINFYNLM